MVEQANKYNKFHPPLDREESSKSPLIGTSEGNIDLNHLINDHFGGT